MDFKTPLSFEEFQEAGYEAWKIQALKELKDDSLEKIFWKTSEKIPAGPYYNQTTKSLTAFHNRINSKNEHSLDERWWENLQTIAIEDNKKTNSLILEALNGGADGIILKIDSTEINFKQIFNDVQLEHCSISFITDLPEVLIEYFNYAEAMGQRENLSGGVFWQSLPAANKLLSSKIQMVKNFRVLGFYALNHTIEEQIINIYNLLKKYPNIGTPQIVLDISIGEDYFQGIAKVKAARIAAFKALSYLNTSFEPEDIVINATTPVYKNEKYGPNENMLKNTTAAMAAIIGGCNSLTSIAEDPESPLHRRIARNVSNILKEESYLGKIVDPSAGSYFLEFLIDQTEKHYSKKIQENLK